MAEELTVVNGRGSEGHGMVRGQGRAQASPGHTTKYRPAGPHPDPGDKDPILRVITISKKQQETARPGSYILCDLPLSPLDLLLAK